MVEIAATAVLAHCRVLYFSRDCVIYTVKEYPYWKIQIVVLLLNATDRSKTTTIAPAGAGTSVSHRQGLYSLPVSLLQLRNSSLQSSAVHYQFGFAQSIDPHHQTVWIRFDRSFDDDTAPTQALQESAPVYRIGTESPHPFRTQ